MKGSAMILVEVVFGLFLIALIFIALQHGAREYMISWGLDNITNTTALETVRFMDNVWILLPIAVVFAIIYYGIAQAQKEKGAYYE